MMAHPPLRLIATKYPLCQSASTALPLQGTDIPVREKREGDRDGGKQQRTRIMTHCMPRAVGKRSSHRKRGRWGKAYFRHHSHRRSMLIAEDVESSGHVRKHARQREGRGKCPGVERNRPKRGQCRLQHTATKSLRTDSPPDSVHLEKWLPKLTWLRYNSMCV